MDAINSIIVILTGLALRLFIPVAVTILAIAFLRQLDARWQAEAEREMNRLVVEKPQCWDLRNCPIELRKECPAPLSPLPCWQVNRLPNGYLREDCLTCKVFLGAPIPVAHAQG